MGGNCSPKNQSRQKRLAKPILFLVGLLSLIWFIARVVPKPSRALYPCQRAAFPLASGFVIWILGLGTTSIFLGRSKWTRSLKGGTSIASAMTVFGLLCLSTYLQTCTQFPSTPVPSTQGSYDNNTITNVDGDMDVGTDVDVDAGEGIATVAIIQSETDAQSIMLEQIRTMVTDAVTKAGGLDFIIDGQTVVLKPNLVTTVTTGGRRLPPEANGVTTDWRIALTVAELVHVRNPNGRILIMEGSVKDTEEAFSQFGYTMDNFGDIVDEIIPIEGRSCRTPDTTHLVEAEAVSGTTYWVDDRYLNADIVISLPVLKTHGSAGITGAIKNIGIGMTPVGKYQNSRSDCTRSFRIINHADPVALSQWITDIYSFHPADFSVMDGLRGMANGPEPSWNGGDYDVDAKNMRLILASDDAVAMDTIEALVMGCDPTQVPYLKMAANYGFGITNQEAITVVGKQVEEVRVPLVGSFACPGQTAPSSADGRIVR